MSRRIALLVLVPWLVVACGSSHEAVPPKRPNNELIIGSFERRPPDGTTVFRFRADGSVTVAHDATKLDRDNLATGTWQLDKDRLTLAYTGGTMCNGGAPGVYQVMLSRVGMRFKKVEDGCDQRAKLDGQTLWRMH